MYLKSIKMTNFRKFGENDNVIEFVDAEAYGKQIQEGQINIAPTTTLIVGKNNSGKSTVIQALKNLLDKNKFSATDFNFCYLNKILHTYNVSKNNAPYMEFKVAIGIDKNNTDLITNLIPFFTLENIEQSELNIFIKYEVVDSVTFEKRLNKIIPLEKSARFDKFLQIIDEEEFSQNYYNANMELIKGFKLKDLIEIASIDANNIHGQKCLSEAFNKIVEYRYEKVIVPAQKEKIQSKIDEINLTLTKIIDDNHTAYINSSLGKIVSKDKLEVLLSADLSFKKLMSNLVKYEYIEKGMHIPENQFGLGYTNLMMIIASLIDYMEKYPETSFNSKVNLITIEEPETYMHPQMQELFIKNINESIETLLVGKQKNVNSQLIITTHSAHIVNSKIHSGNTFNCINYITIKNGYSKAIPLSDNNIVTNTITQENDLKFIKKHIKFKVSELFFSDAIIMVEGASEYTLLPFYIENEKKLNKHYISIFNINGAHAIVYKRLLSLLEIPVLIVTDIDIKRTEKEKSDFKQVCSINSRKTTNKTISEFYGSDELAYLPEYMIDKNIYLAYQNKIGKYYPTSFEEALILTNHDIETVNEILAELHPQLYKKRIGKNKDNNKKNSYYWQSKLENEKSEFSNMLLYKLITDEKSKDLKLPTYIKNGLNYIIDSLNKER